MSYWFKPKRYGYGATPVTWQGWAVTIAFAAFVLLCIWNLNAAQQNLWNWIGTVVLLALATWAVVRVCQLKTEGEWTWRWGDGK